MDRGTTASPWERWLAGTIDALPLLVVSIPFLLRQWGRRERSPWIADLAAVALSGAYQVTTMRRAGQTLGQRALGIRVVDQATGNVPTIGQVTVRWAIAAVPDVVSLLVRRSGAANEHDAMTAVEDIAPEIEALRQRHGGNRHAVNDALMQLYQDRGVNPMDACLPSLVAAVPTLLGRGVLIAPALRAPLRQGLHDRLSQTVVIRAQP
ncbi:MAG: RDD family protein [Actinomycetota bacterium]|nr:RDD family protein [Actinomycetota bacterium]